MLLLHIKSFYLKEIGHFYYCETGVVHCFLSNSESLKTFLKSVGNLANIVLAII